VLFRNKRNFLQTKNPDIYRCIISKAKPRYTRTLHNKIVYVNLILLS